MNKEVKKLMAFIDEEIEGAEKYAECALNAYEEGNKVHASRYALIACQELEHANSLHTMLMEKLSKEEHKYLLELYTDKHREHMHKAAVVKVLIEEAKK